MGAEALCIARWSAVFGVCSQYGKPYARGYLSVCEHGTPGLKNLLKLHAVSERVRIGMTVGEQAENRNYVCCDGGVNLPNVGEIEAAALLSIPPCK